MAGILTKRALINKANSTVVIVSAVAAFFSVFSLVASRTLVSQAAYQNKVISAKKDALKQLKSNVTAAQGLQEAYDEFDQRPTNILGGSRTGSGPRDGSNSRIVLDALPSNYDFPALATSLENIIASRGLTINGISGVDDEVAQQANVASDSPAAIPVPFGISVAGTYPGVQALMLDMENSIRPIEVLNLVLTGDEGNMTMSYTGQTYYQPGKALNIGTKEVK